MQSRALLQRDAIKPFIYRDREGRVLGFGGLATTPMHHRFEVDGHELSTWCAWDSLFIPEILGCSARVASLDPDSGETVRLFVTPKRIESIEPKEAVISFIWPDAQVFTESAANVMAKFCHFIFLFRVTAVRRALGQQKPGDISVLARRRFCAREATKRIQFWGGTGPLNDCSHAQGSMSAFGR